MSVVDATRWLRALLRCLREISKCRCVVARLQSPSRARVDSSTRADLRILTSSQPGSSAFRRLYSSDARDHFPDVWRMLAGRVAVREGVDTLGARSTSVGRAGQRE